MMTMNLIDLHKVLLSGEKFIIAGHENPDGDAVSAAFALAKAIDMIGGKPYVLLGSFSDRYRDMPGNEFLFKGDAAALEADVFVSVDCASKDRLGAALLLFERIETTVNIDHHASNDNYAKHNYVDGESSSTCELLYSLINHMVPMDVDIATNLYTDIVFDTGGFCYGATTFETFQAASRLIRLGVDFARVNRNVLHNHTIAEAKALAKAIDNLKLEAAGKIAVTTLTNAELDGAGATYSDLDGIVEYMLTTGNAAAAALITEREGGSVKVSLRSSDVNLLPVVALHGGGGHKNAAGFNAAGSVAEVARGIVSEINAALIEQNL